MNALHLLLLLFIYLFIAKSRFKNEMAIATEKVRKNRVKKSNKDHA